MVVAQGDVWWADLGELRGAARRFRRPVLIVQCDSLNRSAIATVVCVPLTSNLKWAAAPGNVAMSAADTGLPKDSVANVSQIVTVDKAVLTERAGTVRKQMLALVFAGIDVVLGK